jgi:hypothetical protein
VKKINNIYFGRVYRTIHGAGTSSGLWPLSKNAFIRLCLLIISSFGNVILIDF